MTNLIITPQSKDTFFYDTTIALQGTVVEPQSSALQAISCCPTRDGSVWILFDNKSPAGGSFIKKYNAQTRAFVAQKELTAFIYGDIAGAHCIIERNNGHLITVKRSTHDVVELNPVSGAITTTFSLNIDPFDGWLSPDGNTLAYVDGNILKAWDLVGDMALPDIKDFGFPIHWPYWLPDDTIVVYKGIYDTENEDFLRIDLAGVLVNTYTGLDPFGVVVRGYAASIAENRIWIHSRITSGDFFPISFGISPVQLDDEIALDYIVLGSIETTFPYRNVSEGVCTPFVAGITSLSLNCALGRLTINGADFPTDPIISLQFNGLDIPFTIVSNTSTTIVLQLTSPTTGTYGVNIG